MNTETWVALAVLAIGVAAILAVGVGTLPWRPLIRRRVLVHTDDGRSVMGILWARRGPLVVLRDASTVLAPQTNPVQIDGEVVIERRRVIWMQVLP